MVAMTAQLLKQRFERCPEGIAKLLYDKLLELGYYAITPSYVRGEIERQLAGNKFIVGPGIEIAAWLEEGIY